MDINSSHVLYSSTQWYDTDSKNGLWWMYRNLPNKGADRSSKFISDYTDK